MARGGWNDICPLDKNTAWLYAKKGNEVLLISFLLIVKRVHRYASVCYKRFERLCVGW